MWIARFVKIFDCCFVNQGADSAIAHLDSVGVVPLDGAFNAVSTFQHEDHEGLGVHLLLEIKSLCMGALAAAVGRRRMLMDQQRRIALWIRPATLCTCWKTGPNELAGSGGRDRGYRCSIKPFFALIVRWDW